jgi:hypothetical protein
MLTKIVRRFFVATFLASLAGLLLLAAMFGVVATADVFEFPHRVQPLTQFLFDKGYSLSVMLSTTLFISMLLIL